jgi:hypothetical protein
VQSNASTSSLEANGRPRTSGETIERINEFREADPLLVAASGHRRQRVPRLDLECRGIVARRLGGQADASGMFSPQHVPKIAGWTFVEARVSRAA